MIKNKKKEKGKSYEPKKYITHLSWSSSSETTCLTKVDQLIGPLIGPLITKCQAVEMKKRNICNLKLTVCITMLKLKSGQSAERQRNSAASCG